MDAAAPAYEYATQSAEARGLPSIFTMLARQAQAMLLRLPHKHDPACIRLASENQNHAAA